MAGMGYEWGPNKAKQNLRKHGIAFADAVSIFFDDSAVTIEDIYPEEERFATLGMDALGRILVVVYTWREDNIRLISARKATEKERKQYGG
jgi:uncharacterized DUF497 family protein